MYFWTVRLHTRMPSFNNSPRILSAPQSRLSFAICLIKAIVSSAILGLREAAFDFRCQFKRKSSRCQPPKCVWLHDQEGLLPGTNELCQQNEEDTIGPGDWWPFHPPFEDDKLLAQEGIFRDQLGLASAQIGQVCQWQGGHERFGPTSQARGERIQAASLQLPEVGHNTGHTRSFSIH